MSYKCVELQALDNSLRYIRSGEPYILQPGEVIVRGTTCGNNGQVEEPTDSPVDPIGVNANTLYQELDLAIGRGGAGDWIKTIAMPIAKSIGKADCTPCAAKQLALNAYGLLRTKYGVIDAGLKVKDLLVLAHNKQVQQSLEQLKEWLA